MMTMMGVTRLMNEPERDTVKETIKELMTIINIVNDSTFPDNADTDDLEKRLTDITHKLIDML